MSMSQEEIEALMNGADDFLEDESSENSDASAGEDNFDDILSGIDGITEDASAGEDNFDDILAGIDGITEDDSSSGEENFDDILAGIDGISDDKPAEKKVESKKDTIETMIDQNKYPLPVEKEHKVVNQLNEVAEDSEEKASQIFDVLSFVLDENSEVEKRNKQLLEFVTKQSELLQSLANKFPKIDVFSENLEQANAMLIISKELGERVNSENMKIFEAMELMQYHDINRQKIERVMSVIRKLSDYLNGIFEDDSGKPQVQIAKHISGDSNDTVGAEDIESLISEFAN
jgi:hypothetical protein